MDISGRGPLFEAQERLRMTLAASEVFRAQVLGVSSEGAALARIYHDALPDPQDGETYTRAELEQYRPYAIVYQAQEQGYRWRNDAIGGGVFEFAAAGVVYADICVPLLPDVIAGLSESEVSVAMKSLIGEALADVIQLLGRGGYLAAVNVAIEEGPWRSHQRYVHEEGDYEYCRVRFEWGLG